MENNVKVKEIAATLLKIYEGKAWQYLGTHSNGDLCWKDAVELTVKQALVNISAGIGIRIKPEKILVPWISFSEIPACYIWLRDKGNKFILLKAESRCKEGIIEPFIHIYSRDISYRVSELVNRYEYTTDLKTFLPCGKYVDV